MFNLGLDWDSALTFPSIDNDDGPQTTPWVLTDTLKYFLFALRITGKAVGNGAEKDAICAKVASLLKIVMIITMLPSFILCATVYKFF